MTWTLVTGGAKGLGAEICLTLAEQGFPILVHYRSSQEEAAKMVEACRERGVEAEKIQGDFSTKKSTQAFIQKIQEQFPEIKNLINNVGPYLIKSALTTSLEEWEELFQMNVHAPFALLNAFTPSIKKSHGNIVNIGVAGLSSLRADIYSTAYTLAKSSLWMLTKSLAKELAPSLVCVNMVSPGYLEESVDLPKDVSTLPMKRTASFKEVARMISFLLAEENHYITGQNIEIAGGVRL